MQNTVGNDLVVVYIYIYTHNNYTFHSRENVFMNVGKLNWMTGPSHSHGQCGLFSLHLKWH